MIKKALSGLKIIEYGNFISAPYCTKLMADLGAEVIKMEDPTVGGDESRRYGPFPNDTPHHEKSGLFLWLNANKKGITLNTDTALGKKVLHKLLKEADIFVENFHPAQTRKIGIDYETLQKVNSQLIVVSITPFGQTGPYRNYKAYEINCSAAGGASVASGDPEREPLPLPLYQTYYQAGAAAAGATMAAVLSRDKIGKGQHIDISEVEVPANTLVGTHLTTFIYRGLTGLRKGHHGGYFNYPCGCLPCKDGYVCLIAPQAAQWSRFIDLLGHPEWSEDPKYQDRRAMAESYPDEADALLEPWLKSHTKAEIFKLCKDNHIPFAPIRTIEELPNDPQLSARNFFAELDHPEAGVLKYPGVGYELSETPAKVEIPAPLLGQHNREIFGELLGYSDEAIGNLKENRVI